MYLFNIAIVFCIAFREVWSLEKQEAFAIATGVCGVLEWSFYIVIIVVQVIKSS